MQTMVFTYKPCRVYDGKALVGMAQKWFALANQGYGNGFII